MLKGLIEKRNALLDTLNTMADSLGTGEETRAFSEEEQADFDRIKSEIEAITKTIKSLEAAAGMTKTPPAKAPESGDESRSADAVVAAFIRGEEMRTAESMSTTNTGNIIPSEFSKDIVKKVTELSGIFAMIHKVNSKGEYKQIVEENRVTAGWTDELAEVTKSNAKYKTLKIGHHKLGSLTVISDELLKQAEFDVAGEVKAQMVADFAAKAEEAIIRGTGIDQPTGLTSSGTPYNIPTTKFSSDCLVKIYHALKAPYLAKACWIMSRKTLCAVRLFKDANGRFMFQDDVNDGFVGRILGRPVLISEYMDELEPGKKPILFGDFYSAYKANCNPEMFIRILTELYSIQFASAVLGFMFLDGIPVNRDAYVTATVSDDPTPIEAGGEGKE